MPSIEQELRRAASRYDRCERALREGRDDAIRRASAAGMSLRAIASITGLSFQRIHQIVGRRNVAPCPSHWPDTLDFHVGRL